MVELLSGHEPVGHIDHMELWGAYGQLKDALIHIIKLLDEGNDESVWEENLAAAKKS